MPARSRPNDGVASARLSRGHPRLLACLSKKQGVNGRDERGHDDQERPSIIHGHCHLKQREIKPEQLRPLAKR
jgi:hypothetical protein